MIPTDRTSLTFFEKVFELQQRIFWHNQNSEVTKNHMYASSPLEWPLMDKGIAYWIDRTSNVRIPSRISFQISLIEYCVFSTTFSLRSTYWATFRYGIQAQSLFSPISLSSCSTRFAGIAFATTYLRAPGIILFPPERFVSSVTSSTLYHTSWSTNRCSCTITCPLCYLKLCCSPLS